MAKVEGLSVEVQAADDDDVGDLLALTSVLRDELLILDVTDVRPVEPGATPAGSKGIGTIAGWLVVQLGSGEALSAVVAVVRGWVDRSHREVEVSIGGDTLKITGASSEEQEKIIDAWLTRHAAGT